MKEKLANIEERYNEIISGYSDLNEIGFDELKSTWKELDELKNDAKNICSDLLVGITRENGQFKSDDNIEFNLDEISEITGIANKFIDKTYDDISRIHIEEQRKRDKFAADFRKRNEVREEIRTTKKMLNSLESEIKAIKEELGIPSQLLLDELAKSGLSYTPSVNVSPDRRFYLEQELSAKEKSLNNFREALDTYTTDEQRLTEEMDILKYGGSLLNLEEPSLDNQENNNVSERKNNYEKLHPINPPKPVEALDNNESKTQGQEEKPQNSQENTQENTQEQETEEQKNKDEDKSNVPINKGKQEMIANKSIGGFLLKLGGGILNFAVDMTGQIVEVAKAIYEKIK